ncbi:MAG: SDR family oxidoreductase [Chloroflexi bacterium]|nr:SDR family oxidoreductase [Chloroflexota bacterium]
MRVIVMGASGYVGSHLVPRLIAAGHEVRASARVAEVLSGRGWDAELVSADALRPETLGAALDGVDIVYYLVHSMAAGRDFAALDREAAANVRDAAARAGVRRIVYLGGLQPPDESSEHLGSRRETGEALRVGSVPVTELRAGIVVGPGSAAFEVIRDLVYHLPVMVTPRWVRSRTQPIALDDLLEYLVRLPDVQETAGRTLDVGGPETLTYEEMLRGFAEVVGRRVRILRVSVLSPRLSSYWLDFVTAVPASVARPLVDGLRHDLLADDTEIRRLIPIELHGYAEAVRAALAGERAQQRPARWTEGALPFRAGRPDVSFYSKHAGAERSCGAPADALWSAVLRVGGEEGWHWGWLWRLRGVLDRLIGGVGMRRGRRHPAELRVGDALDFWRVVAIEPGRRLTLLAEMKLPGAAVLEFTVEESEGGGSSLRTDARFHPAGTLGLLYWYALTPIHGALFSGQTRRICERAEQIARAGRGTLS